jgi:PAS domain-containing protein
VRTLDVNNETVELFRAKSKADLLNSLAQVFTPETEPVFVEELVALAEGREMLRAEAQERTLDGQPLSVLFTVHFSPQTGDYSRVVVTLTDITARKQAEESLRQSEARFTQFMQHLEGGILLHGAASRGA